MVAQKFTAVVVMSCMFAATAGAQTYVRQVEPTPDQLSDNVRGQFIRAGDVSPEEYNRLLEEAEKIRAYQGGSSYTSSYSTGYSTTIQNDDGSAVAYDGRPNSSVITGQGYQIELYETPISPTITTTPVAAVPSASYSSGNPNISSNHVVVKGDTLYSLSRRYGVALNDLKSVNGLYGNSISIGQVLQLPGRTQSISQSTTITQPVPVNRNTTLVRTVEPIPFSGIYAVLPGDTLYGISRRACVSVDEIVSENQLSSGNVISPGQRLKMPSGHCLQ